MSSFGALAHIRYVLTKRMGYKVKVGHAGTLDPLATGVLILCTGRATKKIEELQRHTKEYVATLQFGATTASFDMEHPVVQRERETGIHADEKGPRGETGGKADTHRGDRTSRVRPREDAGHHTRGVRQRHLHTLACPRHRRGSRKRRLSHCSTPNTRRRCHDRQVPHIRHFRALARPANTRGLASFLQVCCNAVAPPKQ